VLPLDSPEIGHFQPHILYFWKKIITQEENFMTGQNLGGHLHPPATDCNSGYSWHDLLLCKHCSYSLWYCTAKVDRRETKLYMGRSVLRRMTTRSHTYQHYTEVSSFALIL